jgi:hypothetical protein
MPTPHLTRHGLPGATHDAGGVRSGRTKLAGQQSRTRASVFDAAQLEVHARTFEKTRYGQALHRLLRESGPRRSAKVIGLR